jgi:enoyl-CoA hydratase/carnithine racemase
MTETILYTQKDGIGRVTFDRPAARNALTFVMYDRLAAILANAAQDKSLRALIVAGAGDESFCSGTDIAEFRSFATEKDALDYEARLDGVVGALERCPVPTIAAIAGACTGGGAALAAACDLRIAAATMRFGFPVARTLGNCLSLSNVARLAALIGPARVRDILITARLVGAEEARAWGLVGEVLADAGALAARADELARAVARNAPLTLRATKEALLRLRGSIAAGEGDDLVLMCYMSRDFREGMTAFLEKRQPHFLGE